MNKRAYMYREFHAFTYTLASRDIPSPRQDAHSQDGLRAGDKIRSQDGLCAGT